MPDWNPILYIQYIANRAYIWGDLGGVPFPLDHPCACPPSTNRPCDLPSPPWPTTIMLYDDPYWMVVWNQQTTFCNTYLIILFKLFSQSHVIAGGETRRHLWNLKGLFHENYTSFWTYCLWTVLIWRWMQSLEPKRTVAICFICGEFCLEYKIITKSTYGFPTLPFYL